MALKSIELGSKLRKLETHAPYFVGALFIVAGLLCGIDRLELLKLQTGPLGQPTLLIALLLLGAGCGIWIAAYEMKRSEERYSSLKKEVSRIVSERDLALRQARRLRAQAEGLALMREIHRSTAIPDRSDRLHRILTLVADMFDAREVVLFAAGSIDEQHRKEVVPAAYLRVTSLEELFVAFNSQIFEQLRANQKFFLPALHANDARMRFEGSRLSVTGALLHGDAMLADARWHRTISDQQEELLHREAGDMLETAVQLLDFGPAACRHAAEALIQQRTQHTRIPSALDRTGGGDEALLICVPLIADQCAVGILRIRRNPEGFEDTSAEALEEVLVESSKHIALALKKDEDDRKAITDQLTGLFIKRHFLDILERLRTEASLPNQPGFALVLCDIDHFKSVNDTHGHLTGDMILKGVAQILRTGLRSGDQAFRYGGEEMALLLSGAGADASLQTAERLRVAIEKSVFKGEKGQTVPITISMGVVLYEEQSSGEELISRADRALYASKHGGRNRVTLWRSDLRDPLASKKSTAVAAVHT